MPSWPESQVASDGIILELVQEQNSTAPISSALRPDFSSARRAARSAIWSRSSSV
jgi:hypothetical protein